MKSKFKKFCVGTCLTTILGLGLGCTPKTDFIKIHDVEYGDIPIHSPHTDKVLYNIPGLKIETEGFDNEYIQEIRYYLDGKYLSGLWLSKNRKKWKRYSDELPFVEGNTLGKGKHTLKAILKDCESNRVENSYIFEVK